MPRIQAPWLLNAAVAALLAGCGRQAASTVGDYLHDMDRANAVVQKYHQDPAKYTNDPEVMNASEALSLTMTSTKVRACWPAGQKVVTATTDHACLDRQGYKR
jgi:hypothetical protein